MRDRLERLRRRPIVARGESFLRDLAASLSRDRVTGRASEVAFWWVFTLFPALLVLAAVLGLLEGLIGTSSAEQVRDEIVRVVADFTGSPDNEAVDEVRELFGQGGAGLLTFGVVLALWSTSRSFTALVYTLDEVYGIEEQRGYLQIRAVGLAMAVCTIGAGAVVLVLLVVGPLLGWGEATGDSGGVSGTVSSAWAWLRLPLAAVVLVVFHTAVFCVAPGGSTPWRFQVPGAVTAAAFWCVASVGFSLYLDLAGGTSLVVGVLGGALTLMLWLYLLAIGMLVGGEVNAVRAARRAGRTVQGPHYSEPRD